MQVSVEYQKFHVAFLFYGLLTQANIYFKLIFALFFISPKIH